MKDADFARFMDKVRIDPDGCWYWTASLSLGYGQFSLHGFPYGAHVVSYNHFNGQIQKGLMVRHTCDNRDCVNPAHLISGTHQDNMDDMVERKRQAHNSFPGESHPMVKLTDEQVAEIRRLYVPYSKDFNGKMLAARFGVTQTQISKIVTGRQRKQNA